MLLAEAGCMFMVFILYISGVRGQIKTNCALEGSSVDLTCSNLNSATKWYILHKNGSQAVVQKELSANGHRVTYHTSEDGQTTLTINNLTETDANTYCCTDKPDLCKQNVVRVVVSDLQVKVIPNTEGQTVTLMCNTSCALTETPAAYIWYKNREFLYEDWSPWYQELVSSEEGVTYSCAIKGYEDLRAPDVSVDSVSSTCFTVTYANGRMCSYQQKSENESCSITNPTAPRVQSTAASPVTLTCNTNCPMTDHQTNFSWYQDKRLQTNSEKQQLSVSGSSNGSFSCAVKGSEHLLSPEVCTENNNCQTVNYQTRRICALEGSSVNISSDYSYPYNKMVSSKGWFIKKRNGERYEKHPKVPGRVEYHDKSKNQHMLTLHNLKSQDSGEFIFSLQKDSKVLKEYDLPGVTLVVTGLTVRFAPSPVMTKGQKVTVTCSTSCPLSDDTSYIWSLNNQLLPERRNKHMVLDPVDSQHAGSYSCAVTIRKKHITSTDKTLTVLGLEDRRSAAAAGAGAALLVTVPLIVFLWIRTKRTSGPSPTSEAMDNTEQLNPDPVYENIPPLPTRQQDDYYSTVHFSKNQTLYATVQPHQPKAPEHAAYAVVNIRPKV
ncbi:obscurin-like [Channa argus]|uniref:obscurin-like n=1 Tax=Channa argus TaxID=215402 RepID=UPI003522B001